MRKQLEERALLTETANMLPEWSSHLLFPIASSIAHCTVHQLSAGAFPIAHSVCGGGEIQTNTDTK